MAFYDSSSRYRVSSTGLAADRVARSSGNYTVYTVKAGDTLERIALRVYGDTRRYWELADFNPQIKFPLQLKVGDVLRLPL